MKDKFNRVLKAVCKADDDLNDVYIELSTLVEERCSIKDILAYESLHALDDAITNLEVTKNKLKQRLEAYIHNEDEGHDNPRFMNRFTRVQ